MDLSVVAAHRTGAGPDVVGDDPVGAFARRLAVAFSTRFSVSAAKPMTRHGRLRARLGNGREDVGVQRELELCLDLVLLLELLRRLVGGAPIGDRGGANGDVGGQRRLAWRPTSHAPFRP